MRRWKQWARYVFGALFVLAGANHFRATDFYVSIMPDYLPWHLQLVYLSGVAEIALGVLVAFAYWLTRPSRMRAAEATTRRPEGPEKSTHATLNARSRNSSRSCPQNGSPR